MNEKSGAEWISLVAEELHPEYKRGWFDTLPEIQKHIGKPYRSMFDKAEAKRKQIAAIITKHLPSGDVGKLGEIAEHATMKLRFLPPGALNAEVQQIVLDALMMAASVPANPHAHEIKSDGESIGCIHCGKTAEEIGANPPQVDTTLETKTEYAFEIEKDGIWGRFTHIEHSYLSVESLYKSARFAGHNARIIERTVVEKVLEINNEQPEKTNSK